MFSREYACEHYSRITIGPQRHLEQFRTKFSLFPDLCTSGHEIKQLRMHEDYCTMKAYSSLYIGVLTKAAIGTGLTFNRNYDHSIQLHNVDNVQILVCKKESANTPATFQVYTPGVHEQPKAANAASSSVHDLYTKRYSCFLIYCRHEHIMLKSSPLFF